MMDLYNDIFERWVKAIDEIDTIGSHKEKVSIITYASSFRYDLKDYEKSNFPAGGQLLDHNPDEEMGCHTYGLDSNGRTNDDVNFLFLPLIDPFQICH
jgi:hypothetical protein